MQFFEFAYLLHWKTHFEKKNPQFEHNKMFTY